MKAASLPELSFVHPLPGFPGLRRFVLVRLDDSPGDDAPVDADAGDAVDTGNSDGAADSEEPAGAVIYELRSVEQPSVRFLVGVPTAFFPDYTIELDDQACEELSLAAADDALVLTILSVGADATTTTANLLAPVVINAHTRDAAQVILSGSDWPVRAALA